MNLARLPPALCSALGFPLLLRALGPEQGALAPHSQMLGAASDTAGLRNTLPLALPGHEKQTLREPRAGPQSAPHPSHP